VVLSDILLHRCSSLHPQKAIAKQNSGRWRR